MVKFLELRFYRSHARPCSSFVHKRNEGYRYHPTETPHPNDIATLPEITTLGKINIPSGEIPLKGVVAPADLGRREKKREPGNYECHRCNIVSAEVLVDPRVTGILDSVPSTTLIR